MPEQPSYVPLFRSFFKTVRRLDPETAHELMRIVEDYAFEGVEPDGDGVAQAVFESVRPGIDASFERLERKRRAGSKGGGQRARASRPSNDVADASNDVAEPSTREQNVAEPSNDVADASTANKEKDKEKEKENPSPVGEGGSKGGGAPRTPSTRARFSRPSIDDVRAYGLEYCESRGYPPGIFDADRFHDHFEANGWRVSGRTPMRDWRASVRNWIRTDAERGGYSAREVVRPDDQFSVYD